MCVSSTCRFLLLLAAFPGFIGLCEMYFSFLFLFFLFVFLNTKSFFFLLSPNSDRNSFLSGSIGSLLLVLSSTSFFLFCFSIDHFIESPRFTDCLRRRSYRVLPSFWWIWSGFYLSTGFFSFYGDARLAPICVYCPPLSLLLFHFHPHLHLLLLLLLLLLLPARVQHLFHHHPHRVWLSPVSPYRVFLLFHFFT